MEQCLCTEDEATCYEPVLAAPFRIQLPENGLGKKPWYPHRRLDGVLRACVFGLAESWP